MAESDNAPSKEVQALVDSFYDVVKQIREARVQHGVDGQDIPVYILAGHQTLYKFFNHPNQRAAFARELNVSEENIKVEMANVG